jgi:pimeloyl-ACP methyl ester carboxylesterase
MERLASMRPLRFLGNLLLAAVLLAMMALILFTAYGVVISQAWENTSVEESAPEGDWISVAEQPIHYRLWGPDDGPQVVLIHGFDVEGLETWRENAPALAKAGLRVIAIDLKGFGYSARDKTPHYTWRNQADTLSKVLGELHITKATVVGHGWGAGVAVRLANDQPQLVSQLVLVAPTASPEVLPLWKPLAQVPFVGRTAVWATTSGGPFWGMLRKRGFYDKTAVDAAYLSAALPPTHVVGTIDALLAMAATPADEPAFKPLASVKVPALVLLGREDPYLPEKEGERLASELPNAKLVVIPDAGHYPHVEQKLVVNRQIIDFCVQSAR